MTAIMPTLTNETLAEIDELRAADRRRASSSGIARKPEVMAERLTEFADLLEAGDTRPELIAVYLRNLAATVQGHPR